MRTDTSVTTVTTRGRGGTRLVRSFLVLGVSLATMAASFSGALFTDSDDVTVTGIVTGDIILTSSSSTVNFSLTNMAPGDTASVQQLSITNGGSLALRYSLTSASDEDVLAAELDLDVWLESNEPVANGTCQDVTPTSYLYQGLAGSTGGTLVLGNPAAGSHSGDRPLAAGAAAEVLCFDMSLPTGTGNTAQATTTNITFTFDSEQTANNA